MPSSGPDCGPPRDELSGAGEYHQEDHQGPDRQEEVTPRWVGSKFRRVPSNDPVNTTSVIELYQPAGCNNIYDHLERTGFCDLKVQFATGRKVLYLESGSLAGRAVAVVTYRQRLIAQRAPG